VTGPRILVVEDDIELRDLLRRGLAEEGFTVETASTAMEMMHRAASSGADALVVDVGLPDADGRDACQALRAQGTAAPVLFLTARDALPDRLAGFAAGGDDYLVKPFAFAELLARVTALARRPHGTAPETVLRVGDLEMDLLTRRVQRAGRAIDLQPREFQLLEFLLRHAGQVVTRTMLLEGVWEFHFDPQTNVVDTHISRLRGKIERGFGAPLIHTVRGAGYVVKAPRG
jgi:two-component system OmpR family response regulator